METLKYSIKSIMISFGSIYDGYALQMPTFYHSANISALVVGRFGSKRKRTISRSNTKYAKEEYG